MTFADWHQSTCLFCNLCVPVHAVPSDVWEITGMAVRDQSECVPILDTGCSAVKISLFPHGRCLTAECVDLYPH